MNLKKMTINIVLVAIFFLSLFTSSFATSSYIWSNDSYGLLETVSDTETDLKLESRWSNFNRTIYRLYFI